MAHSCSKALQSVSALARIDDFFFESELANAPPLNCSDTAGAGLIVEGEYRVAKDLVQSGSDQRGLGRKE